MEREGLDMENFGCLCLDVESGNCEISCLGRQNRKPAYHYGMFLSSLDLLLAHPYNREISDLGQL